MLDAREKDTDPNLALRRLLKFVAGVTSLYLRCHRLERSRIQQVKKCIIRDSALFRANKYGISQDILGRGSRNSRKSVKDNLRVLRRVAACFSKESIDCQSRTRFEDWFDSDREQSRRNDYR